ncbi:FG-GAP repeat protein [Streptomyces canus]|uniref:FG-GAP repeat protein n=1 Tax=Streptomyces canus TaxID=58343 RepID=UPI0039A53DE3
MSPYRLGSSLSAGDTDRDGHPDLAVGVLGRGGLRQGGWRRPRLRCGSKGLTGSRSAWFTGRAET